MADFFFDTSALVKRHVIEVGSGWVRSLVHAKAAHDLYIARVTVVEVTSAITRRQHGGHLSLAQAGAMLGHFRRHLAQRYHVIELTPDLFDEAARARASIGSGPTMPCNWLSSSNCTGSYQNAGLGSLTLVSADQALNEAATDEGLTVDDPRSHP